MVLDRCEDQTVTNRKEGRRVPCLCSLNLFSQNTVRQCPEILVKWPRKMTEALNERAKTPRSFGMEMFETIKTLYCCLHKFLYGTQNRKTEYTAALNKGLNYSYQTPLGTRLGSGRVSRLFCLVETSAVWHCNYGFLDTKGNWKLRFFILYCSFEIQEKQDNDKLNFFFFIKEFITLAIKVQKKNEKKETCRNFSTILHSYIPSIFSHKRNILKRISFLFRRWKTQSLTPYGNILFLLIDLTPFTPSKISSGQDQYKGPKIICRNETCFCARLEGTRRKKRERHLSALTECQQRRGVDVQHHNSAALSLSHISLHRWLDRHYGRSRRFE